MTAESATARTFNVGHRTVTLTVPRVGRGEVAGLVCEWQPDVPQALTPAEAAQYQAGLMAALADVLEGLR